MPQVVKPSWDLFDRLVAGAKTKLTICAPWISPAGVQRLQHLLLGTLQGKPLHQVQLFARVADINTDSPGILELVRSLGSAGISTVVRDSPILHAKVYLADRSLALVTSANLSEGGFASNLEAAVIISEPIGINEVIDLLAEIEAATIVVSDADLEHFVINQRPLLLEQAPPVVPSPIIPVWRQQLKSSTAAPMEMPAYTSKQLMQSRAVRLTEVIKWVEASLQAAEDDIQHIDLNDWVGKRVRVWVCPSYIARDLSPYLSQIAGLYSSGELEFGQRLTPERFTMLEGTVEKSLDQGRALFRKKRTRNASIELTRFPDRGSRNPLNNVDSRYLLKIIAVE